jgi:hypothetical protein
MDALLDGESRSLQILREQWRSASLKSRELSGAGFYTNFTIPSEVPRLDTKDFRIGDVLADLGDLKYGAGFILWVKDGTLDFLEAYSYGEDWPPVSDSFTLRYEKGKQRNLPEDCR